MNDDRRFPLKFRVAFETQRPGWRPDELVEGEGAGDGAIFLVLVRQGDEYEFAVSSCDGSEPGRTPLTADDQYKALTFLATSLLGEHDRAPDDLRRRLKRWQQAALKNLLAATRAGVQR